jgi:hypothetical protein
LSDDEKSKLSLHNQNIYEVADKQKYPDDQGEDEINNNEDFHFPIRGHIVVVPYKDIKNINFTYYKIVEVDEEKGLYNVVSVS